MLLTVKDWPTVYYQRTMNIKSGRADREGSKDVELHGYQKCIMQVHNPNLEKPRMKGHQKDCQAELNFKMDKPKVNSYWKSLLSRLGL